MTSESAIPKDEAAGSRLAPLGPRCHFVPSIRARSARSPRLTRWRISSSEQLISAAISA